ncbi:hypothetical protein CEXT_407491 [Caerostris extrusa]|uniref:Uncharacterized protein n=1 Tax=Caerostris extrusa TaxID=172846 RepID=A0AAV4QYP0_CAEEX|nr:hypothetical protein CEXT_407491 [Caerostris extrusa]
MDGCLIASGRNRGIVMAAVNYFSFYQNTSLKETGASVVARQHSHHPLLEACRKGTSIPIKTKNLALNAERPKAKAPSRFSLLDCATDNIDSQPNKRHCPDPCESFSSSVQQQQVQHQAQQSQTPGCKAILFR